MILEAFSGKLKKDYSGSKQAEALLHEWLTEILSQKTLKETSARNPDEALVHQVIQTEIACVTMDDDVWFVGRSETGASLLEALYSYCKSYDNWQFSRWLHHLQASDFPRA